jgi:WD40 repeat protein
VDLEAGFAVFSATECRSLADNPSIAVIGFYADSSRANFVFADWLDGHTNDALAVSSSGQVFLVTEGQSRLIANLDCVRHGFSSVSWSQKRGSLVALVDVGFQLLEFGSLDLLNTRLRGEFPEPLTFSFSSVVAVDQHATAKLLAYAREDGQILVLDTVADSRPRLLTNVNEKPTCLAWSTTGDFIACGLGCGQVVVLATQLIPNQSSPIGARLDNCAVTSISWLDTATVCFSRLDGSITIATLTLDSASVGTEKCQEAVRSSLIESVDSLLLLLGTPPTTLAQVAGGTALAIGTCDGRLFVVDTKTRDNARVDLGLSNWIVSLSSTESGNSLLILTQDGSLRVWHRDSRSVETVSKLPIATARSIVCSADGRQCAALYNPKDLVLYGDKAPRLVTSDAPVAVITIDPRLSEVIVGTETGRVISLASRPAKGSMESAVVGPSSVEFFAWGTFGQELLVGTRTGEIVLLRRDSTEQLRFTVPHCAVTSASWIEDLRSWVMGVDDGSVIIVSLSVEPKILSRFVGHQYPVSSVVPVTGGVVSRDLSGEYRLWSLSRRELVASFKHEPGLYGFTFYDRDTKSILAISESGNTVVLSEDDLTPLARHDIAIAGRRLLLVISGDTLPLDSALYAKNIVIPLTRSEPS